MQASVMQLIPIQDVSEEVITPDFVLLPILGAAEDSESRSLLVHLVKRSIRRILLLVKEFAGHPGRLDGGTIREPQLQPGYVDAVIELLSHSINGAARCSIIGVPTCPYLAHYGAFFRSESWWSVDSPSLPLNLLTLWARGLAWYLFWLAEHGVNS